MGRYADIYRRSLEDPEGFWAEAAEDVIWQKRWDRVLDNDNPPHTRWFVGGQINTCYNALDRHVAEGRGAQAALIHDSPVTGMTTTFTYAALRDAVAAFAGVLRKYGVGYGDRVIVYMPMIPEAVIAMLACTRIGAIHSVVFGGFAATELAKRITDATPETDRLGLLWHRARPGRRLQATARRRHRAVASQAGDLHHRTEGDAAGELGRRARYRMAGRP